MVSINADTGSVKNNFKFFLITIPKKRADHI